MMTAVAVISTSFVVVVAATFVRIARNACEIAALKPTLTVEVSGHVVVKAVAHAVRKVKMAAWFV